MLHLPNHTKQKAMSQFKTIGVKDEAIRQCTHIGVRGLLRAPKAAPFSRSFCFGIIVTTLPPKPNDARHDGATMVGSLYLLLVNTVAAVGPMEPLVSYLIPYDGTVAAFGDA